MNSPTPPVALIAEDEHLLAQALQAELKRAWPELHIAATVGDGASAVTQALALEWARYGIRVNAIAPGYVETDINRGFFQTEAGQAMVKRVPQRRIGTSTELEGALLLLASSAGSYMTGSVVVVDGGHLVSSL
jgi:NAD(P)-dependent dehydrogenase (short-subunit alcohol dehydrogenase family)